MKLTGWPRRQWLIRLAAVGLVICALFLGGKAKKPQSTVAPNADAAESAVRAVAAGVSGSGVSTFLLLGVDSDGLGRASRTDVIVVVFAHYATNSVSLVSIPRDLYVDIPGWQMQRINTAFPHGSVVSDGGGFTLLRETLKLNLGLDVERYALVDFAGFEQIIDAVGGIELAVDCAVEDWRLRGSGLDSSVPDNWELITLRPGIHHMDGKTALWYVRSRRSGGDLDRGRRQHDVLRAIWQQAQSVGLLERMPELWQQITSVVETNFTLPDIIALLPVALNYAPERIESYTLRVNREVTQWRSPAGASVLLPVPEAVARVIQQASTPVTRSRLNGARMLVEIVNATGSSNRLDQLAAHRLARDGFQAHVVAQEMPEQTETVILDFTGHRKSGALQSLQRALGVPDSGVIRQPTGERAHDFRVILGSSYNPCNPDHRSD